MPSINDPAIWLKELFLQLGLNYNLSSFLSTTGLVLIVLFLSWISNFIAKVVILQIVTKIVKRTTSTWDDIFLEQKVFTRLSHFAPALVIWFMAGWALKDYPLWLIAVRKMTYIYMVVVGMVVVNSFIEAWHKIYNTLPISQHRHIKGYVQLLKIFVVFITSLVIISVVFQKNISTLVAGLGAMAAVLMLVFKDTLLGLVASIQLSVNNMLKVGDWISIPGRGVDGLVLDITLNTVKVQNFDMTIFTVPTYSLVNESFQNWKGMEEAGIRQIQRSIFIDMRSIRFLDNELEDKFSGIPILDEYIKSFENKNTSSGKEENETESLFFNSSRITNLGLFRFYAETYLNQHPMIDSKQSVIVKHKAPDGNGLPLQVYVFTTTNKVKYYEDIQSEIFEHLLAILKEFDLKVFQSPTGDDLLSLSKK
ncbi:MAG: mechanosensitive ion channel family protein [Bacteroidales bacterium]|nr:mechanosensitive ion channel family protein [Bacteroidales bacterium]